MVRTRSSLPLAALAVLVAAAPAAAADAPLTVPKAALAKALTCQKAVAKAERTPVLLVTGTGVPGSASWNGGFQKSLTKAGHASCLIEFPFATTGDMQIATQYVVYGVRELQRRAHRQVAVYGISQGGVLPRLALRFWPGIRRLVSDAVLVAGTQHGTTVALGDATSAPPAVLQQGRASKLLAAANAGDETPGATSYTTVRSLADAIVQPVSGPQPTSALAGATNILIQDVCPGRRTDHIGSAFDSVSFAALVDAIRHRGTAKVARLPKNVCAGPFAPGMPEAATRQLIGAGYTIALGKITAQPKVSAEPALRPPFSG